MNFLLDMGLGKSKVQIDIFRYLQRTGEAKRMLVLVPTISAVESWREQCELHAPEQRFAGLSEGMDAAQRWEQITDPQNTIIAVTYMGMLSLVSKIKRADRDSKGTMVINNRMLDKAVGTFGMVVYDEITALKNHASTFFRMAKRIGKRVPRRFGLTGTPVGREPTGLWAEFFAVDQGYALGPTLGLYRGAFFTEDRGDWNERTYTFRKSGKKELRRMMAASSIRYRADDCLDLPEKIRIRVPIIFSDEAWDFYSKARDEVRAARGNFQEIENTYIQMRQLASGFMSGKIGGEKHFVRLANPKLDKLVAMLKTEIAPDEKVLVFNDYVYSGDWIEERLKAEGIKTTRLYSGTRKKGEALRTFKNDPKTQVLIINNQSGAMALNLQVARYMIFYESPNDPIIRQQAEKRIDRAGQKRKVFYIDLYTKNSVEERILECVEEGRDFLRELLDGGQHL